MTLRLTSIVIRANFYCALKMYQAFTEMHYAYSFNFYNCCCYFYFRNEDTEAQVVGLITQVMYRVDVDVGWLIERNFSALPKNSHGCVISSWLREHSGNFHKLNIGTRVAWLKNFDQE